MDRYFLGQDLYGNWYCLPEKKRETFRRLGRKDDAYNYDAWNEIVEYKVELTELTFEKPKWN